MLTTLTSWLRPSSARRRTAPRLRAVEHLEDRTVPNTTPHNLLAGSFGPQDWSNPALITANNNWGGVPSIVGTGGTGLGLSSGANPTAVVTPATGALQVTANEGGNPEDVTYSGVAEFQSLQTVALRASATNQAPNLVLHLNTNGVRATTVTFDIRDINPAPRNSAQQVAVQYRLSTDANFINLPGGYFADVTTPTAGGVTSVSVTLPPRTDNLNPATATVQVRILTTWAGADDEWIGIDNIRAVPGNDAPVANPVGFAATLAAASVSLPFTLSSEPPVPLTIADITGVTGTGGTAVSLTGATLAGSGLNYTLTFASPLAAGDYRVAVRPSTLDSATGNVAVGTPTVLSFSLMSPPPAGELLKSNLFRVAPTAGSPIDLTQAVLAPVGMSLTNYTLTFPNPIATGAYDIDLVYAVQPLFYLIEEGSAFPVVPIAANGTAADADSPGLDFDGGSLTVQVFANGVVSPDNRLTIPQAPSSAGFAYLRSGNQVWYKPLDNGPSFQFGTVTGGTGTAPLVVTFASTQTTHEVVSALMRAIQFNVSVFDTTPRVAQFHLTDGDGVGGSQITAENVPATVLYADFDTFLVINPQPQNNAPSFDIPAAAPSVVEEAGPQTVAAFATNISPGPATYESGQAVTFLVSNDNNGLFSAQPAIAPDGTLTYTAAPDAFGTATVTVQLMDDGGINIPGDVDTSAAKTFTINVRPVNDAPSFSASSPAAVAEDAGPQTVSGFATGFVAGPANESAQTVQAYAVEVLSNPGLFAPGGAPAVSPTGVLTYTPAANANGTATFRVRVFDSGGTTDGGVNVSPWSGPFTISVGAVNDNPAVVGVTSPVLYLAGQPGVPVAGTATVDDSNDGADFGGGTLTVSYTSGATGNDLLAVRDNGGLVTVSGANVSYNGTIVGTTAGGVAGSTLTITFNTFADRTAVEAVLQNVVFSTPAGTIDRVLSISLTDGDGGVSTPVAVTVVVSDEVEAVSLVKSIPTGSVAGPAFTWRLTTDLPASGFNPTNFQLFGTVASSVTDPLTITQVDATTVDITATLTAPVQGTLGINLVDETGLSVGISNLPPNFPGDTSTVYEVDRVGPAVVSIDDGDADDLVPVSPSPRPVTYTVTFDEDVQDGTFTTAALTNVGTAPVTFGAITETSPGVFTVVVTPTGAGTIRLQVLGSASVLDTLGNENPTTFLDDTTVAVDAVAPTVVAPVVNSTASSPANVTAPGQAVTFTVTFSEDIDAASLAGKFSNAGTATATVGTPVETGVPGVVTVTLTPSTTGTLVLRVADVTDVAGNPMAAPYVEATAVTVNLPPTPLNDTYTVAEDSGVFTSPGRGVLTNDTDPNEPSTNLTVDTPAIVLPTKGTLTLRSDGTFDYTPNLDATGSDSFQYRVRDQFGGTATATANITITPVNDPPTYTIAQPSVTVLEDSAPTSGFTILRNILPGPTGEAEAINSVLVSASPAGLFAVQPAIQLVTLPSGELTGVLSFTPAPNQFGTATITVTVSDAGPGNAPNINTRTQQFTIVITPVNDAPTLFLSGNPPVSAEDGGLQTVPTFAGFTAGPNEGGQGQTATYTTTVTGTSGGLTFAAPPTIDANGTLTYQAAADRTGTATVRVTLKDSGGTADGGSDTAPFAQTFTIVVRSVNDLPIANPDAMLVPKGAGPTFIDTLSNDNPDPDGSEVLTVVSVGQPANGTASVAPGGTGVLYAPAPGFTGTDTFTYTINDGNGGPATSTVTVTVRPVPAGQPLFDVVATGTGPGGGPVVRLNSQSTGAFTGTFAAYDPNFRGGVNVAVGDVNGDGVPDIVVTPGPGGGPHVKIVDGTKLGLVDATGAIREDAVLANFFAYSPGFSGGVTVVAADVDGDGRADIITGTGPGGGAHVKVISGKALTQFGNLRDGQVNPSTLLASFFAYDRSFTGGVNVAAGDVDGDGVADIITAAGAGGGSHVKVFSGAGGPIIRSFFAYGPTFTGGVNIAAGDVNGDGLADIVTGAGIGGGPHIKVFDGATTAALASFFGLDVATAKGADVAYRVTKDGTPLVVVGNQRGGSQVRTYAAPDFRLFSAFDAYEPSFLGGVEVG